MQKQNNLYTENYESFLPEAITGYIKEFPNKEDHAHIYGLSLEEKKEFVNLYVRDAQTF